VDRARELFEALDVDGDGDVTKEEFISGCMKDDVFIMLLEKFSGKEVWGIQ
jgi:Ca2+-binding EF-hand superfamily protein